MAEHRSSPRNRPISDETALAAIRRRIDLERARRRQELVFFISLNELDQITRVKFRPPEQVIA